MYNKYSKGFSKLTPTGPKKIGKLHPARNKNNNEKIPLLFLISTKGKVVGCCYLGKYHPQNGLGKQIIIKNSSKSLPFFLPGKIKFNFSMKE